MHTGSAGGLQQRFIATEDDAFKTFFVTLAGDLAETDIAFDTGTTASPDFRYFATPGQDLQIYTSDGVFVRAIEPPTPGEEIDRVIWRLDSSGLFFSVEAELYAADLLAGEAYPVDRDLPNSGRVIYTWATGW